jgi:hypothetical protein
LVTEIFCQFFWSFYTDDGVICKKSFISSFPINIPFVSFSCLVQLGSASSTMMKRSGERGFPCLIPDLRGTASGFLFSMMLAIGIL